MPVDDILPEHESDGSVGGDIDNDMDNDHEEIEENEDGELNSSVELETLPPVEANEEEVEDKKDLMILDENKYDGVCEDDEKKVSIEGKILIHDLF